MLSRLSVKSRVLPNVCTSKRGEFFNQLTVAQTYNKSHTSILTTYKLSMQRYNSQNSRRSLKGSYKLGLNEFVCSLSAEEQQQLLSALKKTSEFSEPPTKETETKVQPPSRAQLKHVALFSGVPFIGFGLLDNTIMLTAGEYIDITFGAWLGITTMAAAALGNMVSDVLGITTAGFVEQSALKLGLKAPTVSLEQLSLRQTRFSANIGRCIGVCIGCLLGMWPLWIFNKSKDENSPNE